VLAEPEEHVRTALMQVLRDDGYPIRKGMEEEQVISTGYRHEIGSIWDRLLVYRLGVNRSRVDATIRSEGIDETRLTIQISYEAKDHIWSSWLDSTPALQQNAANLLRLLKNALGLL
jgi:hypothetical protein